MRLLPAALVSWISRLRLGFRFNDDAPFCFVRLLPSRVKCAHFEINGSEGWKIILDP